MPYVGSRVKRKEDLRLLRGIGKYVGDIHRVGMVHAAILRSTCAHARIIRIDSSRAVMLPGVIGVLTARNMPGLKTIPMRTGRIPGLERSQQTPIATDKVRYVGEPVAVVVAENRYLAEDALELVDVEYETLGAVTDARQSMQPGVPQLHPAVPNNIAANFQVNVGDVDRAFAECDLIFEEEFSTQRHAAVPLETRGLVAEFDEGRGLLTMWGPTKMTHTNWRILSELTGLPQSSPAWSVSRSRPISALARHDSGADREGLFGADLRVAPTPWRRSRIRVPAVPRALAALCGVDSEGLRRPGGGSPVPQHAQPFRAPQPVPRRNQRNAGTVIRTERRTRKGSYRGSRRG
jgi:hypothetical protein